MAIHHSGKILNQAHLLKEVDEKAAALVKGYADDVRPGDMTNREGHAAKVYFNRIFGDGFIRGIKNDRNAALNYGYALLLSIFNKEITAKGYATQLGIHHHNTFNNFNLASDLMEPFRFLVDKIVLKQGEAEFDKDYKLLLLKVLSQDIAYCGQHMILTTAIPRYVRNATEYLCGRIEWDEGMVMHYEDAADESDSDV